MKHLKSTFNKTVVVLAGGIVGSIYGAEPSESPDLPMAYLAQPGGSPNAEPASPPAPSSVWTEQIGSDYGHGTTEIGFSLGAGLGARVFGGTRRHDLAIGKFMIGRVISDEVASDRWYRGRWELFGEVFGGGQFEPGNAYVAGLTPGLRYDFATGTRWVPFFDIGAGVTATDIGRPDLGGLFQFNLQTGPGVRWSVGKNAGVTLQWRYLHLSSAGTEHPNAGVNTSVLYLGMSWLF